MSISSSTSHIGASVSPPKTIGPTTANLGVTNSFASFLVLFRTTLRIFPTVAKMPTPESALFLAKKPKVPPTFDGVDYDDTPRLKAAQDAVIREQWVRNMMARLIREELGKCYYREGVNHLEKCGALRGETIPTERFLLKRKGEREKLAC